MAISVEVRGTGQEAIETALRRLRSLAMEAQLPMEIRKRQFHRNKSERRFHDNVATYNLVMGRRIRQRLHWLASRNLVK